jgi:hypothetical protein
LWWLAVAGVVVPLMVLVTEVVAPVGLEQALDFLYLLAHPIQYQLVQEVLEALIHLMVVILPLVIPLM